MPSSPVASAVENALDLFIDADRIARGVDGQLAPCHIFSYKEDFDYLWGIGDDDNSLASDVTGETSIVLIYDGIPDSSDNSPGPSISVRDYLTGYDWAIYLFLSLIAGNDAPSLRLFILDVTSQQQSQASFAAQRLPGLLPLMPWLRVYRPSDDQTDLQKRFGHLGVGINEMATEVAKGDTESLAATGRDITDAAEERVREAWVNNLTKPGGRHDVSNLVAPLVLAKGVGRAKHVAGNDSRRVALVKQLQTLGVFGQRRESGRVVVSPSKTPRVRNNILGRFDSVRFLLVDDQAETGYAQVLASLFMEGGRAYGVESEDFLGDRNLSIAKSVDPGPLAESLFEATGLPEDSEEKVNWKQPRVIDTLVASDEGSGGDGDQDQRFDVLLLDLRLFGSTGAAGEREVAFLERLLDFYDRSNAADIEDPYLDRAKEAAQKRTQAARAADEAKELMHLALLPLLLSYVDPSLPIVLFSSTRQQDIIEALARRPSIITSFQKPIVSGYDNTMAPRDYVARLSEALSDALRLHELRGLWNRIAEVEWTHAPIFEVAGESKSKLSVYNLPPETTVGDHPWKGKTREKAGRYAPHVRGRSVERGPETFRAVLAEQYLHYLAGGRYFDYATAPSEFFEGALVPKRALDKPWLANAEFELPEDLDARNHVPGALKSIRNKKAHGFVSPPEGREDEEKYRLASMLICLLFLDFVSGEEAASAEKEAVQKMEEHLREEYDHIYRLGGALEPYHLTNDDKVEWVEVVAFSACFAASEAVYENSGNTLLSQETIEAFQRTVDVLTSGHPIASSVKLAAPHPDPVSTIGNDESIVGEIEWYNVKDDYGFVTNPRPGNRNDLYFNPDSMTGDLKSGEEIPEGMLVRVVVVEGPGGPKIKDGSMERI